MRNHSAWFRLGYYMATVQKESKIQLKSLRRGFKQFRDIPNSRPHSPALPETSTANIPNDDSGVVRDRSLSILSTPHLLLSILLRPILLAETPGVEGNRDSRRFNLPPILSTNFSP
jgi:hypothetical protein